MTDPAGAPFKPHRPSDAHVDSILASVIGKAFEFPCSEIVVRGKLNHEEPLFRGSGTISGDVDGEISVQLFDSVERSKEDLRQLMMRMESKELLRFFAADFHATEWVGAWFVPEVRFSRRTPPVLSGSVPKITAKVPLLFSVERKNGTGLYYAETLPLPLQLDTQVVLLRDGKQVFQTHRTDHTRLVDSEFSIEIQNNFSSGFTEIYARHQNGLEPPMAETALRDAIVYTICKASWPRVVVRFFEDDASVSVRRCDLKASSKFPNPLAGSPEKTTPHWDIFKAFLRQYVGKKDLEPPFTAKYIYEVINAGNGTLHGFMVALLPAIEKLFSGLASLADPEMTAEFQSIRAFVKGWSGSPLVKDRALGLLRMLDEPGSRSILKHLEGLGVVSRSEVASWSLLRPKVAHGGLIELTDDDILMHRGRLMTMFHKLILRHVGYRGPVTDFSHPDLFPTDFNWRDA